ncbi:MAG: NAD(P)/FAD-dependent oxidoreductase [Bacteroidia bacterium]
MDKFDFPVIIAGAGPAGATTSLFLTQEKIPHLVLEKGIFPRDKICGDAISGKGLDIIAKIHPEAVKKFGTQQDKTLLTYGIQFSAPNGKSVDIAFPKPKGELPVGFLSKRLEFDNFLYDQLIESKTELWQGVDITDVSYFDGGVEVTLTHENQTKKLRTPLIIGADGSRSIVKRQLQGFERDDKHFCGGIRAYYSGVKDLHPENYLELHFMKELLPGYFWIFPLPNGQANVGMGMLSSDIKKNKVNLRKSMLDMIATHPVFKKRFADAKLEGNVVGWDLPLGSKKRNLSGANYILTGDAASLIDPFTGEGVGNAIVSGLVASRIAKKAIDSNNFSATALQEYDTIIYQKLWNELKLSHRMQQLTTYPWLFNFVVNRIHGSKNLQNIFTNMFTDLDLRKQMQNPLFYFKLLFGKI